MSDDVRRLRRSIVSEDLARTDGSSGEAAAVGVGVRSPSPSRSSSSDADRAKGKSEVLVLNQIDDMGLAAHITLGGMCACCNDRAVL